jgi:hypothetical protein
LLRIPLKSLFEAVAIIVCIILTPVIVVWVLIGLAHVIENMADLPICMSDSFAKFLISLSV